MPQALVWSKAADVTICTMRGSGATWAQIGNTLGLSRNTVIERGRRLRALAPVKVAAPPVEKPVSDDPNRGPLPAGHPLTWRLLTDAPYPKDGDK
jgi:hypothetical protein